MTLGGAIAAALSLPCKRVRIADVGDSVRLLGTDGAHGEAVVLALGDDEAAVFDLLSDASVVVEYADIILLPRGVCNDFP